MEIRFLCVVLFAASAFGQLVTPPPGGGGDGSGTVTSIATGCGLTTGGAPITASGTVSQAILTVAHNGSYAILTGDCGKSLTTNTVAAWTIAQAGTTGFEAGKFWMVQNVGSGSQTVTAATSTFYGGQTAQISGSVLTVAANTGVIIFSDGTNYQVFAAAGGGAGGGPAVQVNGSSTGLTSTANFNGTTPAAGSGFINVTFQASGSSISAETPAVPSGVCAIGNVTGTVTLNDSSCSGSLTGNLPWAYVTMTLTANTTLAVPTFTNGFHQISATENGTGGYTLTYNAAFSNPPAMVTAAGTVNWYNFYWTGSVSALASAGNTSGYSQIPTIADPTCTAPTNTAWAWISSLTGLPKYCNVAGTISQPIIQDGTSAGANQTSATCNANFVMKGMGNDANPDCKQLASTNLSDTANLVRNNAGNTYSTGDQSFAAATSLEVPSGAGATAGAAGRIAYDTTNKNTHVASNGADAIVAPVTSTPTTGDCAQFTVVSSVVTLADSGSGCGSGGGAGTPAKSNVAPITANANSTSPQALQEVSLPAGYLNTSALPVVFHSSGIFSTILTPTVTLTERLCTVSGCGSGTVIPLVVITSTATVTGANNQFVVNFACGTTATGATGNLICHGFGPIDLTSASVTSTVFTDSNTAVSSNIDLTAALFFDTFVTFSSGSASNTMTNQLSFVAVQGAGGSVTSAVIAGTTGNITVSGTCTITTTGTCTLNTGTNIVATAGTQTITGVKTFNPGTISNQPFTPIINTSQATDKLTSNGSAQYFSMNSGAAQIPANTIASGTKLTFHVTVDQVQGGTTGSTTFKMVLCSVSGCGSGTVVPIFTGFTTTGCSGANSTCGDTFVVSCWGTAASGASVTMICGGNGRVIAGYENVQSAVVTAVPTNATLFLNMSYNSVTETGSFASMLATWATYDTF